MAVNYISSPIVVSVNTNSFLGENDWFPENVGEQPDGVVDSGILPELRFKISPSNPATHIVLASDFSFAGLTPSIDFVISNYPIVPLPNQVFGTTHLKGYISGSETTNALGNTQTIVFPPGITQVVIYDSTDTSAYENDPSLPPPTDNEVIVVCGVSPDYPIGQLDVNLMLDIDGDARLIPTPYEPNELIITCELEGADCNANIVSIYQSIYNGVDPNWGGGNFWEWEQIETNNPKIAKIKAIGPLSNPDAPIRTFDSFTPFLIRPNDGYLVSRLFCELIDPSTGQEFDCGASSSSGIYRPYLHRKSFAGGNNLADISFNMVNDQTTNIAIPFWEQDEAQAILDNYFQDYFSFVTIANQGNLSCGGDVPELWLGPSVLDTDGDGVGNSLLFCPQGISNDTWHGMSFFGRTIGCDNPNVIAYTDNSVGITQWASWDYNESYLYWETAQWFGTSTNISTPLTVSNGGLTAFNIPNTYLNYFYQDQASFWGPRIDLIDTKQDSWPLIIQSTSQDGSNNITIYNAVMNAGGTFEALMGGNGVLVDLKALDGWKNMNSDIREIKIKIKVTNNQFTEENVDTVTWASSIMIDNQ